MRGRMRWAGALCGYGRPCASHRIHVDRGFECIFFLCCNLYFERVHREVSAFFDFCFFFYKLECVNRLATEIFGCITLSTC